MTMRISFEIETARDFEILRDFFSRGMPTGEETKEEEVLPPSSPSSLPPYPYPITPYNPPLPEEESREEETTQSRAESRGKLELYGSFVKLSGEEFRKLTDKFGEEETRMMIDRMNCYIAEDPKRQKKYEKRNHYMTLLNWARKDAKETPKQTRQYSFRDIVEMGA